MEHKNIKNRKRETSEEKNNKWERRLMEEQIQIYWLAWRMLERMTIDIQLFQSNWNNIKYFE